MKMRWRIGSAALSCWALGLAGATYADDNKAVTDFGKRAPTANEVIEALRPQQGGDGAMVTRSLRRDVPKAVSLALTFSYNSAALTDEAKKQLSAVGEALASEQLSAVSFQIEGHTDARGAATYNQVLSERRAASVKDYLVRQYKVAPDRLHSLGKGKSDLKDPDNPTSEVNRRVEIVTIPGER